MIWPGRGRDAWVWAAHMCLGGRVRGHPELEHWPAGALPRDMRARVSQPAALLLSIHTCRRGVPQGAPPLLQKLPRCGFAQRLCRAPAVSRGRRPRVGFQVQPRPLRMGDGGTRRPAGGGLLCRAALLPGRLLAAARAVSADCPLPPPAHTHLVAPQSAARAQACLTSTSPSCGCWAAAPARRPRRRRWKPAVRGPLGTRPAWKVLLLAPAGRGGRAVIEPAQLPACCFAIPTDSSGSAAPAPTSRLPRPAGARGPVTRQRSRQQQPTQQQGRAASAAQQEREQRRAREAIPELILGSAGASTGTTRANARHGGNPIAVAAALAATVQQALGQRRATGAAHQHPEVAAWKVRGRRVRPRARDALSPAALPACGWAWFRRPDTLNHCQHPRRPTGT